MVDNTNGHHFLPKDRSRQYSYKTHDHPKSIIVVVANGAFEGETVSLPIS